MGFTHRKKVAFTLIELMIVVTVIGTLTVVALPAFSKYKKNARKAESFVVLKAISDLQISFVVENRFFVNVNQANGGLSALDTSSGGGPAFSPYVFDPMDCWDSLGYPVAPGSVTYYAYSSVSGADSSADSDAYGPTCAPGTIAGVSAGSAGEVALYDPAGSSKQCIGHGITNGDLGIDTGASGTYDFTIPYAISNLGSTGDLATCYISFMLIDTFDNGDSIQKTPIITFEIDNPQSSGGGGSSTSSSSSTTSSSSTSSSGR